MDPLLSDDHTQVGGINAPPFGPFRLTPIEDRKKEMLPGNLFFLCDIFIV